MRTLAVTFFYDADKIVDEYMFFLVASLKPFVQRNIFVSNGEISRRTKGASRHWEQKCSFAQMKASMFGLIRQV